MNIFKILANGDGTINEANVSAFLGYLLDPYADHGLGFEFLEKFIKQILPEFKVKKYDYEILFEQAFKEDKSKQIVDIVILCFENSRGEAKESFAKSIIENDRQLTTFFLIENKIRKSSETKGQLINQFNATISELEKINKIKNFSENISENIYSIYITPNKKDFSEEFISLDRSNHSHHYAWKKDKTNHLEKPENTQNFAGKTDENSSIYEILKTIIHDESKGEIEAINEYTKHTIKSFIQFIANDFKSEQQEEKERKSYSIEGLEIKNYVEVIYNNKNIIIRRFENNMIRIFDKDGKEMNVNVKNILKEIDLQFGFKIYDINKTTQMIGRDVINALNETKNEEAVIL